MINYVMTATAPIRLTLFRRKASRKENSTRIGKSKITVLSASNPLIRNNTQTSDASTQAHNKTLPSEYRHKNDVAPHFDILKKHPVTSSKTNRASNAMNEPKRMTEICHSTQDEGLAVATRRLSRLFKGVPESLKLSGNIQTEITENDIRFSDLTQLSEAYKHFSAPNNVLEAFISNEQSSGNLPVSQRYSAISYAAFEIFSRLDQDIPIRFWVEETEKEITLNVASSSITASAELSEVLTDLLLKALGAKVEFGTLDNDICIKLTVSKRGNYLFEVRRRAVSRTFTVQKPKKQPTSAKTRTYRKS